MPSTTLDTATANTSGPQSAEPRDPKYKDAIFTVPNLICFGRVLGSIVLIAIAYAGWPYWFVGLYAVLSLSDWVDGKLARWLKQRSDFGARLDSFADSVLYAALLVGVVILRWDVVQHEVTWLLVAVASYALTTGVGLWKFGRMPSYHTFGAKKSQWIALFAGITLVLTGWVWPLRLCAVAVTLTNLEATAITMVLKTWEADILTIFYVWPKRKIQSVDPS